MFKRVYGEEKEEMKMVESMIVGTAVILVLLIPMFIIGGFLLNRIHPAIATIILVLIFSPYTIFVLSVAEEYFNF